LAGFGGMPGAPGARAKRWRGALALLSALVAVGIASVARAEAPALHLGLGQFAEVAGTGIECGATADPKSGALNGLACYVKGPGGEVFPWAPQTYLVLIRLGGTIQFWQAEKIRGISIPDVLVFSAPSTANRLNVSLGHDNRPDARFTISPDGGFELGQTTVHCAVRTLGIAAPDERGVACADATSAGTPRANSWGIAISDVAAYVVHFDASGHAVGGLTRLQPR
jgi:hypothetical protein